MECPTVGFIALYLATQLYKYLASYSYIAFAVAIATYVYVELSYITSC